MKTPLRPALWLLLLLNFVVAVTAPMIVDDSQAVATSLGTALVSAGVGFSLPRSPGRNRPRGR
ncbi:hypothetical protein HLK59_34145 [Streptomyces sp. S3(2020)]|uniref:hypothetical protein n=1 Tax=Streptomyces sp. S3(2020) TaxID=2732044 RepID=UPI001489A5C1|nr:hypothetical protein [Streptomyces sp. S3(2020)]NNN35323.1 hypothetical protein [Streptomyces sp. S3(2020)]